MSGTETPPEYRDPFVQMRAAQERVNLIRELAIRWCRDADEEPSAYRFPIPASPDD